MTLDKFLDAEPSLTLDFLKSKKLDGRLTYQRASEAYYVDEDLNLIQFPTGVPRFIDGKGLLADAGSTNLWVDSANPANQTINITGGNTTLGPHFLSFYGTGTISWDDGGNTNIGSGSLVGTVLMKE